MELKRVHLLLLSGRAIKHVLAAMATYYIFRWRSAAAVSSHLTACGEVAEAV
jgi:hypothetical protein